MNSQTRLLRRHTPEYNFIGDYKTGVTIRWGKTIKENPLLAPFPELADVSISNRCSKGCDFCYKDSHPDGEIMSFDTYKFVLEQLQSKEFGPVFQIAIGGGEPAQHPDIQDILRITKESNIIPNLTTNAEMIDNKVLDAYKRYCGAVAISICDINPEFFRKNIKPFLKNGIKTNVHFLLTRKSIGCSIEILKGKWDSYLKDVNAVIFLTHKSLGRAKEKDNLIYNDELKEFLKLIDLRKSRLNFGFDACFVPLLLKFTNVDARLVDACECGFFSVYIDENLSVKPCSFANKSEFSFDLDRYSFKEIWENKFQEYRSEIRNLCDLNCEHHDDCRGGCLFHPYLNLCGPCS